MPGALVKKEEQGSSRAVERLAQGFNGIETGALIKALLPSLPQLRLPFSRASPNIVRIILDEGSKRPSPGDEIRGTIRLLLAEPVAVGSITVAVVGMSKSRAIRSTSTSPRMIYKNNIELLASSIEIEPETAVLAPKRYEWPFQITLPRTCTIAESPFDENTRRFNSSLTQPLPPTFSDSNFTSMRAMCSIDYHVTAKLVSKRADQKDIHHKVPLSIFMSDARALMASEGANTSTMRCTFKFRSAMASPLGTPPESPGPKVSSPSLASIFKSSVLSFTLPSHSFDLDADLPRSGRLSEPLPISLRLVWQSTGSKAAGQAPIAPVSLTSATVNLMSKTLIRANTEDPEEDAGFVNDSGSLHQIWRSKPVVISELKEPIAALPDELDLAKFMFVRPHHFQPAFRTHNISREYVLQVICNLECAEESFVAKYEVENFGIITEGGVEDAFEEKRTLDKEEEAALKDLDSDVEDEEAGTEAETEAEASTANESNPASAAN